MTALIQILMLVAAGANALTGLVGGALWWQVRPRRGWWPLLRATQALTVAVALAAGVVYAAGFRPGRDLFWLYVLLPVAVGSVAEQLRVLSAQTVLDARGIESPAAVGELPADRQRSVVVAILRREMGVMALSALAVAFLLLRAYAEAA